jgi:hypothetical protein
MGKKVGYMCPSCGYDTDVTYCDHCDAVVEWDGEVHGRAHCTGCRREINGVTCRRCGHKFSLR